MTEAESFSAGPAGLLNPVDTVKKHVSHLMGKLGAANRTEAVARGRELGLVSEDRFRG